MKIIYIGGYGRSGSTLLDIILGQSKYIESGGEIVHAQIDIKKNRICTCNKSSEKCSVWSKVVNKIGSETDTGYHHLYGFDNYSLLIKSLMPWYEPAKNVTDYYKKVNRVIYFSLIQNGEYLVDSSKTARNAASRPFALRRYANVDIYFIHIIRNPISVMKSLLSGKNSNLELIINGNEYYHLIMCLLSWPIANYYALLNRIIIGKEKSCVIFFEDLITNPEHSISEIEHILNINLSDVKDYIRNGGEQQPLHILSGNRMRMEKLILNNNLPRLNLLEKFLYYLFFSWQIKIFSGQWRKL